MQKSALIQPRTSRPKPLHNVIARFVRSQFSSHIERLMIAVRTHLRALFIFAHAISSSDHHHPYNILGNKLSPYKEAPKFLADESQPIVFGAANHVLLQHEELGRSRPFHNLALLITKQNKPGVIFLPVSFSTCSYRISRHFDNLCTIK